MHLDTNYREHDLCCYVDIRVGGIIGRQSQLTYCGLKWTWFIPASFSSDLCRLSSCTTSMENLALFDLPLGRIMPEEPTTLSISASHLEHEPVTFLREDIRGPDLHINGVNLARNHRRSVGSEVIAM